ncbi:MAG: carbamoyltransferase HypF [Campylobacterales bacterium]|nr:carbamoyltransferase HypF [Campylobacterales bacterium]
MKRFSYLIGGVVQGVGFRPFIYKVAKELHLDGFVKNTSLGVFLEIQGSKESIEDFDKALEEKLPPLAKIESIEKNQIELTDKSGFEILISEDRDLKITLVSPDIKVCDDCLEDIRTNRRFENYIATNCTNCGTRYSIIETVPYDRKNTSMSKFVMCEDCKKEYEDPTNRRFHAQPVACKKCGPQLSVDLKTVSECIKSGKIVAIKGIGGFHIVCDSVNDEVIEKLRMVKNRPFKPFALMCRDLEQVKSLAEVTEKEEEILNSKEAPIVVLTKKENKNISDLVAPKIDRIGCFLPYTPLHVLLFDYLENPIIATSGNLGDEPIITTGEEIEKKLPFVDLIVDFDRDIVNGVDDSLEQVVNDEIQILRLGRGYAPKVLKLPKKIDKKILAVGGNQKNTIALAFEDTLILSPHIGDLNSLEAFGFFERTVETFKRFYDFEPDLIVCDKHPNYETTKWAKRQDVEVMEVQHHLAHIYSVKAEFGLSGDYLGFSFDGTGYGEDGTLWGGEIFLGDERKYNFKPIKLLGGEKAIKEPRRVALSMVFDRYSLEEALELDLPLIRSFKESEIKILHQSYSKNLNAVKSSSVGRLFDGIASFSDLCQFQSYEGEAGLLCEEAYDRKVSESFEYKIIDNQIEIEFDFFHKDLVSLFINTLVKIVIEISKQEKREVILTGGVFQNRTLLGLVIHRLKEESIKHFYNQQTPTNDGGVSLGQIYYTVQNKEETKKRKFGQLQGKYKVPEDFNKESEEINSMFYGDMK